MNERKTERTKGKQNIRMQECMNARTNERNIAREKKERIKEKKERYKQTEERGITGSKYCRPRIAPA